MIYALIIGLVILLLYGKNKGYTWRELVYMSFSGVYKARNILVTFVLIGMLTALWRDAGTISTIVCYASGMIRQSGFLLLTFLLNCIVSFLTGTAFGTAATMGVICATIASALQMNPVLIGGAVLSGVYFGDRCSPISTSALLVSELTGTNIFQNMKRMMRSAFVPFVVTCVLYLLAELLSSHGGEIPDLKSLFAQEFELSWIALLPAAVLLVLSLMQVNVKIAMSVSILTAIPICVFLQHTPVLELPKIMLAGYTSVNAEVGTMMNGGGIVSMARVATIVCLSSSYSGIFQKTGLLDEIKKKVMILSDKSRPYTAVLCTAIVSSMVACNQTLAIMLTHQLCQQVENKNEEFALYLEDSAVVIAPLIPWSIAGAVPLTAVGAPKESLLFAFFLYLLPLWKVFGLIKPSRFAKIKPSMRF